MPITSPFRLNSGPPELPWLIEASVWMKSSNGELLMFRLSALTIPLLTDMPMPSGLPIAITGSPISSLLLSPQRTAVSACCVCTLITATSTIGAVPTNLADAVRPSENLTLIW